MLTATTNADIHHDPTLTTPPPPPPPPMTITVPPPMDLSGPCIPGAINLIDDANIGQSQGWESSSGPSACNETFLATNSATGLSLSCYDTHLFPGRYEVRAYFGTSALWFHATWQTCLVWLCGC